MLATKDLFDIVVAKRNGGYPPEGKHSTDLDVSKLSKTPSTLMESTC